MATSVYKWLFIPLLGIILSSAKPLPVHPFHVSVTEINHNATDKTLEISCKLFTDDFEKVLVQNYKTKVDLNHPANKAAMDTLVKKYILSHLSLKVNGKPVTLSYVGFEIETEAAFAYVEVDNVPALTKLEINNSLLFDFFDDQISIMHVIEAGNRKSTKLNYPDKEAVFSY